MSTVLTPQTVESTGFTDYDQYQFEGNSGTVENKRKFIEGLRIKASIYHAAQYAGVGRTTVYRWMEQDSEFAQAVGDAHEDAADVMESSVYERAFNDNLLAMFWLKAHRPKFRDKATVDITVVQGEIEERMKQVVGGQVQIQPFLPPPADSQKESLPVSSPTTTTNNDDHR